MATIRVQGIEGIADLGDDLKAIPVNMRRVMAVVVERNLKAGNTSAQGISRRMAGPHGREYYKRLSFEMTGMLAGEYGPHAPKTDYVGVDKSAGAMRDLEKSADIIAPRFRLDVHRSLDDLFWPG
jgi:hypothetical protein